MAEFYWRGSTGHAGNSAAGYPPSFGHPGNTYDFRDINLGSVGAGLTGTCWNVAENWLVKNYGASGGCAQESDFPSNITLTTASRAPGAGDKVTFTRIFAGRSACARPGNSNTTYLLGAGVTGDLPVAPCLWGGFIDPDIGLATGQVNKYTDGGGWINAGTGKTSGKVNEINVHYSYLMSLRKISGPTEHPSLEMEYPARGFPLGFDANNFTSVESLTTSGGKYAKTAGGTFSGLQLNCSRFFLPEDGYQIGDVVNEIAGNKGPGNFNHITDNSVTVVLSDITTFEPESKHVINALGCTLGSVECNAGNHGRRGGIDAINNIEKRPYSYNGNVGRLNIDAFTPTTRGGAYNNLPTTINTGIFLNEVVGGYKNITTGPKAVPTINVATKYRLRPIELNCDITTLNVLPENTKASRTASGATEAEKAEAGFPVSGHNSDILHLQPVQLTARANPLAGFHSVGTLTLDDYNAVHEVTLESTSDRSLKGETNQFGIDCGATFDNVTIKGGRLFTGVTYGAIVDGCIHGGDGRGDYGEILIKDGSLHGQAFVDHRHFDDATWKRWKIGTGTVHPSAQEGWTFVDGGAVTIWTCDHYVAADYAFTGVTGDSGTTIKRVRFAARPTKG